MSAGFDRRTFLRGAALSGGAGAVALLAGACAGRGAGEENVVSLWGITGNRVTYEQQLIEAFSRDHPEIEVRVDQVPSQGAGDATSVITAVRGGTAPDLWLLDRFSAAQYAAIGLIEPVDELIAQYEGGSKEEFLAQWLPFSIRELTYQGATYGLPFDTDARGMFVNRGMLRAAGIDPDEFDWEQNGPVTMDRMIEVNDRLSRREGGVYSRMGFIPWYGEGWPFTWGLPLGARYFDEQQCGMLMDSPEVRGIYEFYAEWAERLDYAATDTFLATYEPTGGPPGQLAFLGDRLAFMVSVPGLVQTFEKYAPDGFDFTTAFNPVLHEGDPRYSWSGGSALCLPKGSKRNRAVWEFMKYYSGTPGQRVFMPPATAVPTRVDVLADPAGSAASVRYFVELVKDSTSRPALPVGSAWWDALADARDSVLIGSATPQEAVERAQARVDPLMQTYCPFTLPAL